MQMEEKVLKLLFAAIAIFTIFHLIYSSETHIHGLSVDFHSILAESTPFKIDLLSSDPSIYFCKIAFQSYHENPYLFPMFQDIIRKSGCHGNYIRRISYSKLQEGIPELKSPSNFSEDAMNKWQIPAGFIFHESRVGSTLVANILASDFDNLVFSEPDILHNALFDCKNKSETFCMTLFRNLILLMGQGSSNTHRRYFIKFQTNVSSKMSLILEAFPNVPWVFLFRNPIQMLMSHLDPRKVNNGYSCRSKKSDSSLALLHKASPQEITATTNSSKTNAKDFPKEAWCAAHFELVCQAALASFQSYRYYKPDPHVVHPFSKNRGDMSTSYASAQNISQLPAIDSSGTIPPEPTTITANATRPELRGIMLNYESLPGSIFTLLLPYLFRLTVSNSTYQHMSVTARMYSKSGTASPMTTVHLRNKKQIDIVFIGDSQDKVNRATKELSYWSERVMEETYRTMQRYSYEALVELLARDPAQPPVSTNTSKQQLAARNDLSQVAVVVEVVLPGNESSTGLASPSFNWSILATVPPMSVS